MYDARNDDNQYKNILAMCTTTKIPVLVFAVSDA